MKIQSSTRLLLPILCFIFMLLPSLVVAQSLNKLPEVIPPSPTVSNLMHFEEVPIDNYSGQPNIEIPIYTKNIGSSFSLPLSLRYSTMGIRVDERSGWLGNGWSLSGEGVISRTVMHIRDEANDVTPSPSGRYEIGILHNGFFDHDFSLGSLTANKTNMPFQNYLWNAAGAGSGQYNSSGSEENGAYDKEFDLYQLNLFGMSARFIIINNNNTLEAKMLNNDFNLKIIISHDANTFIINHFTIVDTRGMKYKMSVKEDQTVNTGSGSVMQNGDLGSLSASTFEYTSAWKISSVENSHGQSLATFEYQEVTEEFNAPKSYTEAHIKSISSGVSANELFGYPGDTNDPYGQKAYNNSVVIPKRRVTHTSMVIDSKKLFKILFNDQTEVKVTLENYQHPEYNSSGGVLNKIEVKDANGNVSKNIDFEYTTTPNDRLFLTSLEETMGSITQSYALNYDDMTDLPNVKNFDANFSIKDMWGYYRGPESNSIPDIYKYGELTNKNFVTTGVLTSITYPTGGIKEFNFEPNTFDHKGSGLFTDADFKLLNKDNWIENNEYVQYNNLNSANNISPSPIFYVSEEQEVQFIPTIVINENPNNTNTYLDPNGSITIKLEKVDKNGDFIEYSGTFDFLNNKLITIPEGNYRLNVISLNLPDPNDTEVEVIGTLHYKDFKNNLDRYIYGGGLRVQSVLFKDNDLSIEKEIQYHYGDSGGQQPNDTSTTGVIDGFLTNRKEYSKTEGYLLTYGTSSGNSTTLDEHPVDITYNMVEHMNNVYVSMNKSSYVGYEKVAVLETGNGRSVFTYTSPTINGYETYSSSFGYPFTPEKDKSHLHGALLDHKVYDNSNKILKETSNDYYLPIEVPQGTYPHIYDFPTCNSGRFYAKYSSYLSTVPDPGREHPSYGQVYSNYGNCTNIYPLETPLYYNEVNLYFTKFLLKETISKDYFYSGSTAKIVETTKEFIYNDDNYQIAEEKTSLNGTSDYYQTKYYYPVSTNIPSNYQGSASSITKLNNLNKVNEVLVSEQYKNGAKLSETHTTYFEPTTNLVMPNRIKTAKNGNTLEDRIIYHRYDAYGNPQEVSQKDGMRISYIWGYNGQYPVAKLENCSYSAIPINLRNSIENATPSGMANALQLLRSSSDVDVKKALITTITYDPLFGFTSVTDPKGDTQTYYYDDFGRLEQVKDKQGKILQEYEYHYKN